MPKQIQDGVRTRFVACLFLSACAFSSACAAGGQDATTSVESELACHDKITICHHTHSDTNSTVTISISRHAWPAHEGHGDTIGACEPTPPPEPRCGNGIAEGAEECDAADLKGLTCEAALGAGATGNLACSADCRLVRDQCLSVPLCSVCGPTICDPQCRLIPCDPGPD